MLVLTILLCIFLLVSLGGLWHTSLIENNLVDYFVPFLPLEYRHVVMCAKAEMASMGLKPDNNIANKVASDLAYFPKTERVFCVTGCKTSRQKLYYYDKDTNVKSRDQSRIPLLGGPSP